MYIFVLYAMLIWYAVHRYRRRWAAWAVLAASIPAAYIVYRLSTALITPDNAIFQFVAGSYELLILAVGALIAVQPRTRPARHPCKSCRYDLTGNTSGACPECGTLIDGAQRRLLTAE